MWIYGEEGKSPCFSLLCVPSRSPVELFSHCSVLSKEQWHQFLGGSGNRRPTAPVVCLQKLSWPSMELRGFGRLFMEEVCAWQCLCSTALYTPCLMRIFLAKSRWLCLGEAAQVNSFCHYQSIIACKTWWLSYSSKQMTSFSDRLIKGKGINWCGKSLLQKCDFPGIIP